MDISNYIHMECLQEPNSVKRLHEREFLKAIGINLEWNLWLSDLYHSNIEQIRRHNLEYEVLINIVILLKFDLSKNY